MEVPGEFRREIISDDQGVVVNEKAGHHKQE
jgi:hypothetical protein